MRQRARELGLDPGSPLPDAWIPVDWSDRYDAAAAAAARIALTFDEAAREILALTRSENE